jgi:tRNA G18 (ribose-2'-O)-methylase SpoU
MITVDDPADPRVDEYRALNDQPYRRRFEGDRIVMVEGFVAIDRLLDSGLTVRSVLLAPSRVQRFETRAAILEAAGVPVYVADREVITAVVGFDLHRGVIASATRPRPAATGDLVAEARRLVVVEGLNDAENLGAIARAARAFGLDGLIADPTTTDAATRRTVRVSMGEILLLPVARPSVAEWPDLVDRLRRAGITTWAMTPAPDADDLWAVPVPDRLAVVLGAEGPGLSAHVLRRVDRRVRIPISPAVDSLNVAQAAAVTFAAISRPGTTTTPG